uniref:Protein LURP-one-related 15 n=1 Tax=Araucaria cunninghamii TaxID=56994 RepID=A0A0D6R3E9_ARACU
MEYQQPHFQDQGVCVVGQQFCAPYPIELTVQQKAISFSGGDFTVTDSGGNVVFKVAGKVMSLHDRRVLQDAAGNPLLTLKQKTFTMHRTWEAYRGNSSDQQNFLFTARKSSMIQLKTALDVFLAGNKDEKHTDFHVKGSFLERSCTIYRGDRIVAEMKRKHTVTNVLLGKDTFVVVMQPGIDYAFIVALIVLLDEINDDRKDD